MTPSLPEHWLPLLAQPVAILGNGVSGAGARELLAAVGARGVVYDAKGSEFSPEAAQRHRLAVFSPGFAPAHPWLIRARAAGCECLGEIDFAGLFWRGSVVAVTGTNGKTTLTEFLAHALESVGRRAVAVGNVGRAFSKLAAQAYGGTAEMTAVCEVSSFQAETLRHLRPDAVLWTNFAEDHLERHGTMENYFAAKAVLAGRSRSVFSGTSVKAFAEGRTSTEWPAAAAGVPVWVPTEGRPADPDLAGTIFERYPQSENFLLAAAWWQASGLDPEALVAAARTFQPGGHRLARVAEIAGVSYWDDSKATNFHAVEAALSGFAEPVILIAGGRSKGGNIAGFARRISPKVRRAFLIGETGPALARAFGAEGVSHACCATFANAVRSSAECARPGDHVVLSPGFASFDMFQNYADRGEQFARLVHELDPAGAAH